MPNQCPIVRTLRRPLTLGVMTIGNTPQKSVCFLACCSSTLGSIYHWAYSKLPPRSLFPVRAFASLRTNSWSFRGTDAAVSRRIDQNLVLLLSTAYSVGAYATTNVALFDFPVRLNCTLCRRSLLGSGVQIPLVSTMRFATPSPTPCFPPFSEPLK